jgi:hypothetical protein
MQDQVTTIDTQDIQTLFTEDNFAARRTTGNNLFDPESLLTGKEEAEGLTYLDKRVYPSQEIYEKICAGEIPVSDVPNLAPRRRSSLAQRIAYLDPSAVTLNNDADYQHLLQTAA